MDFNISAKFNRFLEEPFWILSVEAPPSDLAERFERAYVEIRAMFMCESPFLLTTQTEGKPAFGQLVPSVYFCKPKEFNFGDYTLINSAFWDQCLSEVDFVGSLATIGNLIKRREVEKTFENWERNLNFHCFNVF